MSGCCCEKCRNVEWLQRAAEENGDGVIMDVLGYPAATLQVFGDLSGGSDVEVQFLSGTDWYPLPVTNVSTGVVTTSGIITAEGTYRVDTTGLQKIKAEVTGYAGTDSVNVVGTAVCESGGGGAASGGGGPTTDVNVAEWGGAATTLGQKPMATSVPVTIASDQSQVPADIVGSGTYTDISATDAKPAQGTTGNTEILGVAAFANSPNLGAWTQIRAGNTGVNGSSEALRTLNTLPMGQYNAAPLVLADTDITTVQLDSAGNLKTVPGPSTTANTPAIVTAAASDAIAANAARKLWSIQNIGTNPLFVRLGTGASITVFHFVLKPGAAADDGNGGFMSDEIWKGVISYAGTSPRLVVTELT